MKGMIVTCLTLLFVAQTAMADEAEDKLEKRITQKVLSEHHTTVAKAGEKKENKKDSKAKQEQKAEKHENKAKSEAHKPPPPPSHKPPTHKPTPGHH
jgi:hypothetical protein